MTDPDWSVVERMTAPVQILRLSANSQGRSVFDRVEMKLAMRDFAPPAAPLYVSDMQRAARFAILRLPVGWIGERHPSPARQILFCLRGTVLVTPTLGTPESVGASDAWLMEDTTGDGHETAVISEEPFDAVVIQLP
jgi:hypothetical protein